MKGVATDEMLRGAGNERRFGDSPMGQPLELSFKFMEGEERTR